MIELMVTMGLLAVLVAVGLPQLQGMSSGNRMTSTINALAADLSLARSEAVTRNTTVTINPAAVGDWTTGWTLDTPTARIRTAGSIPNNMTLTIAGSATMSYSNQGLNAEGTVVSFQLCEPTRKVRTIQITATGRHTTSLGAAPQPTCP